MLGNPQKLTTGFRLMFTNILGRFCGAKTAIAIARSYASIKSESYWRDLTRNKR